MKIMIFEPSSDDSKYEGVVKWEMEYLRGGRQKSDLKGLPFRSPIFIKFGYFAG